MGKPDLNVPYQFAVNGTEVGVTRDGQPTGQTFLTTDKDASASASPLHRFLVSIGRSPMDASRICEQIEKGQSVRGVMGDR